MRTVAAIEAPPSEQEQKEAAADFEDWITSWVTKYEEQERRGEKKSN
jgi:hypothetical protein